MDAVVFGYGSLISPFSLASKLQNPGKLSPVYETVGEPYVTPEERRGWQALRTDIERAPAKLHGFRRYYSKESVRGGAVLEAVRTGAPSDWINGVLIDGLSGTQYDAISATEPGYRTLTLEDPDVDFYSPTDAERYAGDAVEIFVREADPAELSVSVTRNHTYHERIVAGIQTLADDYDDSVASDFLADFAETTYELTDETAESIRFGPIAKTDRHRGSTDAGW